ncbi:hypothetical protein Rs2_01387 [Raphanus sativus]|nr:hypothetical protein Rs2_01387 [Raphanus sativus]
MLGAAGFQLTKLERAQSVRSIDSQERDNGSALEESTTSNVERFLESVTPSVPAHSHNYLSKVAEREKGGSDVVELLQPPPPYFVLGDVWESFTEWSAYGTGVPLSLNNNNYYKDRVIQYYVPSLSAIQIYTASSDASLSSSLQARRGGEESDSDFKDSSSEGSSSESETGLCCYPKEQISSSDDGDEPLSSQGHLIF